MSNWDKAGELQTEAREIHRKMLWQAGCLANEGKSSAEIDAATASKLERYNALQAEIEITMQAWAAE